jgi:hypothetical protein
VTPSLSQLVREGSVEDCTPSGLGLLSFFDPLDRDLENMDGIRGDVIW